MKESRLNREMLQAPRREGRRERMAACQAETTSDVAQAIRILPSEYVDELRRTCPSTASFETAVRNTVLAQACVQALAAAPNDIKSAALRVLEEITPRDSDSTLLDYVLGALMGLSLDTTVPSVLRYQAAAVIDALCQALKEKQE